MAGEIDAAHVVDDAIEDGVSGGWIADQVVRFVDGDLTGDDGLMGVTFSEDFEEVAPCGGGVGEFGEKTHLWDQRQFIFCRS